MFRHLEAEPLDLPDQVVFRMHRRHAVIGNYRERRLRVPAQRNFENLSQSLLIPFESPANRFRIIALIVQAAIDFTQI